MDEEFGVRPGRDKVGNPFSDSVTVPEKLHSQVSVFSPAYDRDLHRQRGGFLRDGYLEFELGPDIQLDVAAQSATGW